jgi:hypothetical protein
VEPTSSSDSVATGTATGRVAADCRPGLVSSYKTSDPQTAPTRVYRGENRLRRLKKALPEAAHHLTAECEMGGFRARVAFVTLTYRPEVQYSPRHVSQLQKCYRRWLEHRGHVYRGLWVMETTKKGKPHYHLVMWLPRGLTPPKPDKQGWWPHGMTQVAWSTNPIGYCVKYASKGNTGPIPLHARLYGICGLRRMRQSFRHRMRPYWLRELVDQADRIIRAPGGGWVNPDTGELHRSPYVITRRCKNWSWIEFALRSECVQDALGVCGLTQCAPR